MVTITSQFCSFCKAKPITVEVTEAQYGSLKYGELIQKVLPELSDNQRERFITGICETCWEKEIAEPKEEV